MKLVSKIVLLLFGGMLSYYCVFCLDKQQFSPTTIEKTVNNEKCSVINKESCIVVAIFNDSSILRKGEPFLVTVKIENVSNETFRLNHFPRIILQKAGISKANKDIMGNSYQSIVYFDSDSEFVKKEFLEKGERIEFKIDITDLGWGHPNQSYLVGDNLFEIVPKGEYELYLEVFRDETENNKEFVIRISSNTSKVSIK